MFHLHDFEYFAKIRVSQSYGASDTGVLSHKGRYDIRPSFLHRNLVHMRPDPFLFPRLVIVFMVFYGFHYLRFREKDKL